MTIEIKDVEFANNNYTRVRFRRVDVERGVTQLAELVVPENYERGVNKDWDTILDNYDVEQLKQERQKKIELFLERREYEKTRSESLKEANELKELFNEKSHHIKMPYAESDEDKTLIRRAPNNICLQYVVFELMKKYVDNNSGVIEDMFDAIEDAMYEEE